MDENKMKGSRQWIKSSLLIAVIALVYFFIAHAGLYIAYEKTNASPVWPASGFAFAMILFFGYRISPAIFVGSFAANWVSLHINGIESSSSIVASLLIATGNTLEILTGKFLLNRLRKTDDPFYKSRDFFTFLGITLVMCAVSAVVGVSTVTIVGVSPLSLLDQVGITWWSGNVAGVIVVTPLLLCWLDRQEYKLSIKRQIEAGLIYISILLLSLSIFEVHYLFSIPLTLPEYCIIPFILWMTVRFRHREVTIAIALVTGIAVWATTNGQGPFAFESMNQSLIQLLIFISIVSVSQLAILVTMTERKKTAEALQYAEQHYRAIFENAMEGIYQTTVDGKFIVANPALATMFGFQSPAKLISSVTDIGKQLFENPHEYTQLMELLVKQGSVYNVKAKCLKKNNEVIWVRIHARANYDIDGRITSFEGAVEDITARVIHDSEIKQKNEALANINHQMEKLLYSTSHDLRSPITSILGMLNVLRLQVTDTGVLDYMNKIEYSANKLDKVIHNIVNFSKNNYQQVNNEKIECRSLLEGVLARFENEEQSKKIVWDISIEEVVPFYSDKERIEIILENILRNAITFSDTSKTKPYIKIWMKVTEANALLEISDNGIGIGENHLDHVCNMFYRASEQSKGAGLGLFIVKESLLKLNGTIKIESDLRIGTKCFIRIPNAHQAVTPSGASAN